MKSFLEFLSEKKKLSPNHWEHLISTHDKTDFHEDLIKVVDNAYKHTTLGSFVKSIQDVQASDWEVLSKDGEEIKDAVFHRPARANEVWVGHKIQGIGHDGTLAGKMIAINKVVKLVKEPGWWIEASDAMARVLDRKQSHVVKDEAILKKIFPTIETIKEDGTYTRTVGHNDRVTEKLYGYPKLK